MYRARAELNTQSDWNEHPANMGYKPQPGILGAPCRDAACALHILILSFGLYSDLRSHNNAYVFFWPYGVKSVRTECLDHLLIFNEAHLRRAISGYAAYFNYWPPHRSLGQRAPCGSTVHQFRPRGANRKITAQPVLGGLHHIYRRAA